MRDSDGKVVVSLCISQTPTQKPIVAEALALWRSMQICNEMALQQIVFQSDCQAVVKVVTSRGEDQSEIANLINDIKFLLRQRMDWEIMFVFREGNEVAHALAKLASKGVTELI